MVDQPGTPSGEPPSCRHRWRIAVPNGPISPGVCRLCGAERDFPTTTEGSAWDTTSADYAGRPHRGRFGRPPQLDTPSS
jgi:hypothetical protein